MGHSTCRGGPSSTRTPPWPHNEEQTCDGCDRCPQCDRLEITKLWCWRCCGKLVACAGCVDRLATHIVDQGPPEGQFQTGGIMAGYRAARSIIRGARAPKTQLEVLQRYPRLTAHLICKSLGYFTPEGAAGAILAYLEGRAYWCEWYTHMAGFNEEELLKVGREVLGQAFHSRHYHHGYMASYTLARRIVDHVRQGKRGPELASWF